MTDNRRIIHVNVRDDMVKLVRTIVLKDGSKRDSGDPRPIGRLDIDHIEYEVIR